MSLKNRLLLTSFFILILLTACTTETPKKNETITTQQETTQEVTQPEVQEIQIEGATIFKIDAGKIPVYLILDNYNMDIYGCGNKAHGPATVDSITSILFYRKNVNLRDLIITDNSADSIGGCKEILMAFPTLDHTYIYAEPIDTPEYNDLVAWTPSSELMEEDKPFNYTYNGQVINFSKIDYPIVKTNGSDFRQA